MWELDHKEGWMWKNWCFWTVVLAKTLESPLDCKEIKPVNSQGNQPCIIIGMSDSEAEATWCEELTHWKRPWCWERLRAGGEGGDRGWDGWMTSPAQWTWVWANSGRLWRTEKPGVLQSMGCKESDNLVTEKQQHYSMTSAVNNTVLYFWKLLREQKFPTYTHTQLQLVEMMELLTNFCSQHFAIYTPINSSVCTR